jgi:hypothetical protein
LIFDSLSPINCSRVLTCVISWSLGWKPATRYVPTPTTAMKLSTTSSAIA